MIDHEDEIRLSKCIKHVSCECIFEAKERPTQFLEYILSHIHVMSDVSTAPLPNRELLTSNCTELSATCRHSALSGARKHRRRIRAVRHGRAAACTLQTAMTEQDRGRPASIIQKCAVPACRNPYKHWARNVHLRKLLTRLSPAVRRSQPLLLRFVASKPTNVAVSR